MAAAVANLTLLANTTPPDSDTASFALVAVAVLWLTHRSLHTEPEPSAPGRWSATSRLRPAPSGAAAQRSGLGKMPGFRPDF
jgi:hypothetical protein